MTGSPILSSLQIETPSESDYLNCIRCGACLAVCPTYQQGLDEIASPRARVVLARKALEGELTLSPNLADKMYSCFACMACNQVCPVGIKPAELTIAMRHVQEQIQPRGWKSRLFNKLRPASTLLDAATFPLRLYEISGLRRLVYLLGLRRLLPENIRDLEAMLPPLPQRPLGRTLPETVPAQGREIYKVGFFLGCAQSLLFAEQSAASVRVLARNGCTVETPKEVQCCGMPARGYGRLDIARAQAMHNIQVFEDLQVDVIVTDCATCGSTLKEYRHLLEDDSKWAERAGDFSRRVRDISQFLAEIPLQKPAGRIERKVTYHDPCHLRRGQDIYEQPRALLEMIDGLELVELPEADWCCGSAGSQLITHYQTSSEVLNRKIGNLARTGAEVIASGCPGCQMQLTTGIKRGGLQVEVVHPVALLDQAYEAYDG